MSKVDYVSMTDQELKRYFLEHRDDAEAFHAYMDRRHTCPQKEIIAAGELDHLPFDEQLRVVDERMRSHFSNQLG